MRGWSPGYALAAFCFITSWNSGNSESTGIGSGNEPLSKLFVEERLQGVAVRLDTAW